MDENKHATLAFPPPSPGFSPSTLPFFVVGIGTSAGGIQALSRFLEAMPNDNGMAFVIVLHLSPNHESTIDQILQKKTAMPVLQVNETVRIEQNHVYIIPPTKDLVMSDGDLKIVNATRPQGRHIAIDMFMRTLAETHRERAVGIILSGSGGDGAVGIARIKEQGGMTFAQLPDDAEYDSMPRTAIDTGTVDFVLPVAEIPEKLLELTRKAESIELPPIVNLDQRIDLQTIEAPAQDAEAALRKILLDLHQRTGHDFQHYKRATILRRLERRLQVAGMPNLVAYQVYLEQHDAEVRALLQDMLIGVTNFFRDREAFEALERTVIPKIFHDAVGEATPIRAWSVGCATGQEAYSIAMLLAEQNALKGQSRPIQVFASDIDERALAVARKGQYPESINTDVTPGRLRQFFEKENAQYCVRQEIREKVLFAHHNILRDPPFSRLHLICCRNLLIYLDRDIQKKVFEILHFALCPGGYLFLGSAESAEEVPDMFITVDKKRRIYQASKGSAGGFRTMPQTMMTSQTRTPDKVPSLRRERQELLSAREVHRRLMEELGTPSLLVDQHDNVLYATRQAWRFMQTPAGEPSQNIFAIVHPDLRDDLRSALFQAKQFHQHQETPYLPVRLGNETACVRILIRPGPQEYAGIGTSLLLFEEGQPRTVKSHDADGNVLAAHLEEELRHTKEQLRSVIEQYETTLADLRASNEELQSINEELRSTSEELETSKEELQSLNEELMTVNTELKSKVEETFKANDDLQNFVAATEIATIFIDRTMRIQRFTKPATALFNIILSDIGRPLLDITHHLDYPDLINDIEQVFERLQTKDREVNSSNGQWFIARLLPYRTSQDRIAGVMLTFIDISKRRATEEKLRLSEQRLRLIANSTADYAIVTLDANGLVTSWNNGAEYLFGYTEHEMLGRSAELLYPPADCAAGEFETELARARNEGRVEDDRWHLRKDGKQVFCSGITSPLTSEAVSGYVMIARDVTGARQAQEQQAASLVSEKAGRVEAEEGTRLRDEFFAVLSHELKQPLNLIQLTTEMMRSLPESATQPALARGMTTIRRMVESQVKIIDDLMDLSRLHTGKLSFSYGEVNLNETMSQMLRHMQVEAQQKQIALSLELSKQALFVYGDSVRIEQIIWNLLSNALKFSPPGGKVDIRLIHAGSGACIEASDAGVGIAPEDLPLIFDMFRQADTGPTRRFGGLGIGLALVKQLVEGHGGHVEAHSEGLGRGARFRVFLPLSTAQQTASPTTDAGERGTLKGKRILLVDDDTETVESLDYLLSIEGAQVQTAISTTEALDIVRTNVAPFDLIISDIGMPEMDGYSLLRELRKLAPTASTPAIALSGYTRPSDVRRTLDAGFTSHLRKPVDLDEMFSLASRLCS